MAVRRFVDHRVDQQAGVLSDKQHYHDELALFTPRNLESLNTFQGHFEEDDLWGRADSDLRGTGSLRSWGQSSSACPHSRPICFVKSNQATRLQFVYFWDLHLKEVFWLSTWSNMLNAGIY